jgi:hypothetical protein
VRVALQCVLAPCGVFMIAVGQARQLLYANAGRFVIVWTGIPLGWYLAGLPGVVWATTLAELPMLVVFWRAMKKDGLLRLPRELFAFGALASGSAAAWALKLAIEHVLHRGI